MSGSSAKWFDLSEFDAKLERRSTGGLSHFKLVLEVPASRLEPLIPEDPSRSIMTDLADMGWDTKAAGADRYQLTNFAPMNRKSEIVTALRPFFSADEIEGSHVSVHSLSQGEVVEGLQARQLITATELKQDIEGVAERDFARITDSVKKAQELQAERLKRQTNVIFAGNGREVYNHLTDTIMERFGWEEDEAAVWTQRNMAIAARPNQTFGMWMTSLGHALAEKDEVAKGTWTDQVISKMMHLDGDVEDLHESMVNSTTVLTTRSIYASNPKGENPVTSVRDAVLWRQYDLGPEALDAIQSDIPVNEAFSYYKDRIPFMVVRDSSVPSRLLAQSMVAVDRALDVVSAELELPRDKLMPRQTTVPVRFSYDAVNAGGDHLGNARQIKSDDAEADSVKEDDRAALTMNISVMKGRSFVHELGHLIDFGNGITDEERHAILSKSGVLAEAKAAIDRQFPQGGAYAEYLLDEREIFARSFDAHMTNVVRSGGDTNLKALGGMHTTQGFDHAAPYGDLERSTAFISELKDTLALRREVRHEASRKAEAEITAGSGAAYATHGMG